MRPVTYVEEEYDESLQGAGRYEEVLEESTPTSGCFFEKTQVGKDPGESCEHFNARYLTKFLLRAG